MIILKEVVVFFDVANMVGINILEPKDETQTFFEYLKNNTGELFLGYPDIFDSDLREFFKDIATEEEQNIDYKLLSRQILTLSKKTFSFLQKHGNLYSFWIDVLGNKSLGNIKLLQLKFLKD